MFEVDVYTYPCRSEAMSPIVLFLRGNGPATLQFLSRQFLNEFSLKLSQTILLKTVIFSLFTVRQSNSKCLKSGSLLIDNFFGRN